MKIYASTYRGIESLVLESPALRAEFLPQAGAKLASLLDKEHGVEHLWQPKADPYPLPEYDAPFTRNEMFGLDEMFPTLCECHYEHAPWKGTRLPDHGEVWALPWDVEILDGAALHFWTYGVRLPYRLDKWVRFSDERILRSEYEARNLSPFDFDFIWTIHPLFNVVEGSRLILPPGVEQIINVFGGRGGRLGEPYALHPWPKTQTPTGEPYALDRISPRQTRQWEKYYVHGKMPEGWCALQRPDTGDTVALSYPVEALPYLGFWINECGWDEQYNMGFEPCTAAHDRLDFAAKWGTSATLCGKSTRRWHMNLTVARHAPLKGVHADGALY